MLLLLLLLRLLLLGLPRVRFADVGSSITRRAERREILPVRASEPRTLARARAYRDSLGGFAAPTSRCSRGTSPRRDRPHTLDSARPAAPFVARLTQRGCRRRRSLSLSLSRGTGNGEAPRFPRASHRRACSLPPTWIALDSPPVKFAAFRPSRHPRTRVNSRRALPIAPQWRALHPRR